MAAQVIFYRNNVPCNPRLTGEGKTARYCRFIKGHIDAINIANPNLNATLNVNLSAKKGDYPFRFTGNDEHLLYNLFMERIG